MFNFFITEEKISEDKVIITDADYNHAINVLRLKVGDEFLASVNGQSHLCEIEQITKTQVIAKITVKDYLDTSLPIKIYLFQGLPKSDKMELIIQKAVELGVDQIFPVETERCVVKLDQKKKDAKTSRWQSIAESAAKQSKRTVIPQVLSAISFKELLEKIKTVDVFLLPYECANGMQATKDALSDIKSGMTVGVFIGPEGGFSEKEVISCQNLGAKIISLGKRILRTETAAITSLSMLMLHAETNL